MNKYVLLLLAAAATASAAQEAREPLSLEVAPQVSIPLGRDSDILGLGGGANLAVRISPKAPRFLSLEAGGGFTALPAVVASGGPVDSAVLSLFWPWAGLSAGFEPLDRLRIGARVCGGYYFAVLDADVPDSSGSNPMFAAGLGMDYRLSKSIGLGLGAEYRAFLGLCSDLSVRLGASYRFAAAKPPGLKPYPGLVVEELALEPVFPVLYKYYADHPVGRMVVRNAGKIPIEDLRVEFFVNQYMDNPTAAAGLEFLKGGASAEIEIRALFNDRVLGISEATKVQAVVSLTNSAAGEPYGDRRVETLRVFDRNAVTWTDDRRVAAFVASRDPTTMRFAKNVASAAQAGVSGSIDGALLNAIALHEALGLYGLSYQVDPTTPFAEFHGKKAAVDYIQFPNQTLEFKAGDCDDLSILNCALLESLGVETAFVTVPGHIYMAFALETPGAEAAKRFQRPGDLIIREGKAWVPVEITSIKEGFLKAWDLGARQWRENEPKGQAALHPVREAWRLYEAVGFSGEAAAISLPSEKAILEAFRRELKAYVEREVAPQEADLKKRILAAQDDPRLINSLGVLYARYGLTDRAEAEFRRATAKREYVPALVNLGNLAYRAGDMPKAAEWYARADRAQPKSALPLLGLARCAYELKDYPAASRHYAALKAADPAFAKQYDYLDSPGIGAAGSARASETARRREAVEWSE